MCGWLEGSARWQSSDQRSWCSPRRWHGATTCTTSPRSRSPRSSGSAGSRWRGCSTRHARWGWSASRSCRRGTLDLDASARLQEEFGLRHAVVVDVHDRDAAALRHQLGEAAAHLLQEVVTARDVVGLPWSRSVHAVVGALESLPPVEVVQLTGAIVLPDFDSSAVDIVRRASRLAGRHLAGVLRAVRARRRRQRRGAAAPAPCGGGPGPGVIGHDRGRRHRGVGAR